MQLIMLKQMEMKKKVLIIDDSRPIRLLLEAVFSREFTVISAEDGLAAMSWLSGGNTADLIITDLQMPHIDGWELVQFLSGSHLYRDIPVIVLSAVLNPSDGGIGHCSNVRAFVTKPFDPVKLVELAHNILNPQLSVVYS